MSGLNITQRRVGDVVILDQDGKIALGETNRSLHDSLKGLAESDDLTACCPRGAPVIQWPADMTTTARIERVEAPRAQSPYHQGRRMADRRRRRRIVAVFAAALSRLAPDLAHMGAGDGAVACFRRW